MNAHDDADLDAWLAAARAELPDDGFSASVMRRVQAEQAARQCTLDAALALERLRRREARARRRSRWQWLGTGVGVALAVAVFAWAGDAGSVALAGPQTLALLVGLAAAAWWLADVADV